MEDNVLDVLGKVGNRGIPSQETLASKDNLVRYDFIITVHEISVSVSCTC